MNPRLSFQYWTIIPASNPEEDIEEFSMINTGIGNDMCWMKFESEEAGGQVVISA
jgi:hypothetical protein